MYYCCALVNKIASLLLFLAHSYADKTFCDSQIRPESRFRRIEAIPSFNIWLQGDNVDNSEDSNAYGPVSKKLLIGQAERIVWPPSRWGLVKKIAPAEGRAWWG